MGCVTFRVKKSSGCIKPGSVLDDEDRDIFLWLNHSFYLNKIGNPGASNFVIFRFNAGVLK